MNFIPDRDPMAGIPRPSMLIETRPNGDSAEIFAGDAADLRHNFWVLRSEDPLKVRGARVEIDWRIPVGCGGELLTSPGRDHDLATAKICVLELATNRIRHSVTAAGINKRLLYLMWLYRWRLEIGVQRLDLVTPSLFKDYCDRAKKGGVVQLVDVPQRIESLVEAVRDGKWAWPVQVRQGKRALIFPKIAEQLGITDYILRNNHGLLLKSLRITNPELALPADVGLESLGLGDDTDTVGTSFGITQAMNLLRPWSYLHLLSSNGTLTHDRLTFDPFAKTPFSNVAQMIAGPKAAALDEQRTRTLTPRELLSLLDHAALWVLDYSKPIISIAERAVAAGSIIQMGPKSGEPTRKTREAYRQELSKILAEHKRLYPGRVPNMLLPLWKRASSTERGVAIYEALVCVVAACFIVIAAFSARRKREIESLQVGCAAKDQFGYVWLSAYIEKTIRDIDQIPVPPLVLEAVRILEELGSEGREATGEPWLGDIRVTSPPLNGPRFRKGDGTTYIERDLAEHIFKFCQILETFNSDLRGLRARPHEFRRAFAVMYYHGNRYATFDALSRFLRHFDPEMTRRYVTEGSAGRLAALAQRTAAEGEIAVEREAELKVMAELVAKNIKEQAALVEEVRQEAFVERALEVLDGTENPIGHGAHTLRAELNILVGLARDKIRLGATGNGSPDEVRTSVAAQLREHAKTHYLEPHPGKHAHCRCRPDNEEDLLRAVCLIKKAAATGEAGKRPDYAFSTIRDCLGCWHGIVLSENKRVLSERAEIYAEAAEKGSSDPVRIAAQDKLARLKAGICDAEEASRRGSLA